MIIQWNRTYSATGVIVWSGAETSITVTPFAGIACFTSEAITRPAFNVESIARAAATNETIVRPAFSAEAITRPALTDETIVRPAFTNEDIDRC